MSDLTPLQPVGPFFHVWLGDEPRGTASLAGPGARGRRIAVHGRMLDGAGQPVADGLVEVWQADSEGRYRHPADPRAADTDPALANYGRTATDAEGRFRFETVMPGAVPGSGGVRQAPHLLARVFAPGILVPYWTRVYFAGERANDADPVLSRVPPNRRATLLAQPAGGDEYGFDIVLQGEGETVFFDA